MIAQFRDRREAGRLLANELRTYANRSDVLVLALPPGGIPVALEVSRSLRASLDVFAVCPLYLPNRGRPIIGPIIGAVGTGGARVLSSEAVQGLGISSSVIASVTTTGIQNLASREQLYRGNRPAASVRGRTVILVDDGTATIPILRAAAAMLRQQQPARLVLALPATPYLTCCELRSEVDEIVCAASQAASWPVGVCYDVSAQSTEEAVDSLLEGEARKDFAVASNS
jgi:putative phosphoribosyl transferase